MKPKHFKRVEKHKSAHNVCGKQDKDVKTSPGSPGTNMKRFLATQNFIKKSVK